MQIELTPEEREEQMLPKLPKKKRQIAKSKAKFCYIFHITKEQE